MDDEGAAEPVVLLPFVEDDLQCTHANDKQREADVIEPQFRAAPRLALGDHRRRIGEHARRHQRQQDADRHVEQKHPAPAEIVGDPAAERRPDRRRKNHGDAVGGKGLAALGRRKRIGEDRLRVRLKPAAADPLQTAGNDQHGKARRDAAQERGDTKADDAGDEITLAPDCRGKPAADRQDDGVGDQIRGQHPSRFVLACRQTAGDVLQRDIGDRNVEHFHKGGKPDRYRDQPRVRAAGAAGLRRSHRTLSYLILTLGTTDMPGPSGKCRLGGASKTILTGTRCTTLT